MGLLRLELDIDADVYPELHATLTSLVSDVSRGERLRQLAAAGLVWEKLRIRGQAALHGVAPGPETAFGGTGAAAAAYPGLAPVPAPLPAPAPKPAKASSRSTSRQASPAPVRPPAAPPRSGPAGFVDLALDAAPEPAEAPWPPVLMDVVEPRSYTHAVPVPPSDDRPSRPMPLGPVAVPAPAPVRAAAPAPVSAPVLAVVPAPAPRSASVPMPEPVSSPVPVPVPVTQPAAAAADEPTVAVAVAAVDPPRLPDIPIEHRSSTRSRLARMKERGLFKNE